MAITFENDNEIIIYALEKIIAFSCINQYFFVASCVWWIASVTGLDEGLRIHIDTLIEQHNITQRGVSSTPRDIARSVSINRDDTDQVSLPTQKNKPKGKARKSRRLRIAKALRKLKDKE